MLKAYRLNPKIGIRKTLSATSVKNKMYESVLGKNTTWEEDVPPKVVDIIDTKLGNSIEKFARLEDETTRVVGMKFPKDGYWSK